MWTIWRLQFRYKDEWDPEFTDRFGWFVNIKLIQEELFVWIWVGSYFNWEKPFEDANEYKCDTSIVLMSLHHHEEDLALKSPMTTDIDGMLLLMLLKRFSKLDKTTQIANWLLFWLRER